MRARKSVVLVAAALLFGCGGGGGTKAVSGLQPEQEQVFHLGLVRGDAPTTVPLVVVKPFPDAGTVELAGNPSGAFGPLAGTLPMDLASGANAVVRVAFAPPAAPADAHQEGTFRILFRLADSDATFPVTLRVDADVETPSARLQQTHLQLGSVPVGQAVPCSITFENTSIVTPVTVADVQLAAGDFSIAPGALPVPIAVAPGATFPVKLVYASVTETTASSLLRVFHSAAAVPLEATLDAKGIPSRVIVDFGAVPLDPVTHETASLSFDVAPEGVGFLLEAWGDPEALIDLAGLEGPSGRVYETENLDGPLDWLSGYPAGAKGLLNVEVPDSLRPEVQLVPGGGTYRFRLRQDTAEPVLVVRVTITQRRLVDLTEGTLDVRVFLADGLALTNRAKPMTDAKLNTALKTIDGILGASGIRLGTITFVFLEPPFDILTNEEETEALFAVNSAAPPQGLELNLFLVRDISYGITAIAGGSPGPWVDGMPFSGVAVAYDPEPAVQLGVIAAHEIAHYLGGLGTALLPEPDDTQPMLRHPLVNPGLPENLLSPAGTYQQAQLVAASMPLPTSGWCGTCMRPVR